MKVHNSEEYIAEYLNNPNIDKRFAEALIERIKTINTPSSNTISWFDVRRSRVTEFMSQLLLEKEFNCIFYDEADKRINVTPINVNKHTPGIDVPGIFNNINEFKFAACEGKASKDSNIPCNSSESLLVDILNGSLAVRTGINNQDITHLHFRRSHLHITQDAKIYIDRKLDEIFSVYGKKTI